MSDAFAAKLESLKLWDALTSVAAAAKVWRKAEKRLALIQIGELAGDEKAAQVECDKAIHVLRILTDKIPLP